MMGPRQADQAALFYEFSLERHVSASHLLRSIDRFVDLSDVRSHLAPFYSSTGRPSIDPELLVRMLLVGYCYGIRSERRLCEEVHLNLAYRWFCRLGLEAPIPDHSTFSKNRHGRFRESDVFRHVFEGVVERCMAEGLVRGEGFAIAPGRILATVNGTPIRMRPGENEWKNPVFDHRCVHSGRCACNNQGIESDCDAGSAARGSAVAQPPGSSAGNRQSLSAAGRGRHHIVAGSGCLSRAVAKRADSRHASWSSPARTLAAYHRVH